MLFLLLASPATAWANAGVQIARDGETRLVTKDIDDERWSIVRRPDGSITGNVFFADGRPPVFLECHVIDSEEADRFSCASARRCLRWPCEGEWSQLGDVTAPASFFEVVGAPPSDAPPPNELSIAQIAGDYELVDRGTGRIRTGFMTITRSGQFVWSNEEVESLAFLSLAAGSIRPRDDGSLHVEHWLERWRLPSRGEFVWIDAPTDARLVDGSLSLTLRFNRALADGDPQAWETTWRSAPLRAPRTDDTVDSAAGVQRSRNGRDHLVTKTVGGQRWSIAKFPNGILGNVYSSENEPAAFVDCDIVDENDGQLTADCWGADACLSWPCPNAWTPLGTVAIASDFFAPPESPDRDPTEVVADLAGEYQLIAFERDGDGLDESSEFWPDGVGGWLEISPDGLYSRSFFVSDLESSYDLGAMTVGDAHRIDTYGVSVNVRGLGIAGQYSAERRDAEIEYDESTLTIMRERRDRYPKREKYVWRRTE